MTTGTPFARGDEVIGVVKQVLPNGDAEVELNEKGRQIFGNMIVRIAAVPPLKFRELEQTDTPHIVGG